MLPLCIQMILLIPYFQVFPPHSQQVQPQQPCKKQDPLRLPSRNPLTSLLFSYNCAHILTHLTILYFLSGSVEDREPGLFCSLFPSAQSRYIQKCQVFNRRMKLEYVSVVFLLLWRIRISMRQASGFQKLFSSGLT